MCSNIQETTRTMRLLGSVNLPAAPFVTPPPPASMLFCSPISLSSMYLVVWLLVALASASLDVPVSTVPSIEENRSPHIVAQFPSTDPNRYGLFPTEANATKEGALRLNHLTIDPNTGRLYTGAVNRLLQMDSNLKLEEYVSTGPRLDNPQCYATGCPSRDTTTSWMDNVNKLLLADLEAQTLIACGSLLQGACEKYKMSNISIKPEFVPRSVAANDETSSTYAFIGPERYNPWRKTSILYVGTTFTNNGEYRHDVPAISSRNLATLDFAEFTFYRQSILYIDVKYRDHFLVKYVYGFNASEYAYFVLVQKQSYLPEQEELGYISRFARSCISDSNYDSYTEVTLQCSVDVGDGKQQVYNLVQDAKLAVAGSDLAMQLGIAVGDLVFVSVFSPSKGITNEPLPRSALCVYSLQEIETKFNENIHMCFNGSIKYRNMGYVSGPIQDGKCPSAGTTGNIMHFCEVGLKISGVSPIIGQAVLHFPNDFVTSVAVANTESHTVAFLGTNDGVLKKVLLSGTEASIYESIVIDKGQKLLPDTVIAPGGDYIYVLSTSKVSKVRVEHCSSYTNCSSCLDARDPYCGWCSLEKRCTVRGACQKASQSSPRWLSLGTGQQCIDFEQVLPDRIPINQMTTVQLTIRTLPELPAGANYKCVFGNADPIDALMTGFGLSCPTPPVAGRPSIPDESDHVLVPLSVRSSETNKDFVSRNFAYFDCSRHSVCLDCVKSQWACSWCVYDNRCTHNTSGCQGNVISGENSQTSLAAHGIQYCPRFAPREEPLMLPNNVPKEIVLQVENLPQPQIGHTGFQCIVTIEGANLRVQARVDSSRFIVCDKTIYSYEEATGEYEAAVTVVWNTNHHVDQTTVVLYKCEVLGSHREHADCSLCLTRDPRYECTWCGTSCVYRHSCMYSPFAVCPKPRIDMIKPLSGPIEGGTLVTIEGSNLGLRKSDVEGKIHIGNTPCTLVDYEVSVRIVCRTGRHEATDTASVVVGNNAGDTESAVLFNYKDIRLTGVHPSMGPQSGGTQLAISGTYLNIGSTIAAYLDELPCRVNATQASSTRLTCVTSKSGRVRQVHTLTLSIDGANRTLYGNPYNYTLDPTIMEIKPLRSFASGGRMITVHGTNLDTIQKPEMEVYFEDEVEPVNRTVCVVLNPTQMECPSPSVSGRFRSLRRIERSTSESTTSDASFSDLGDGDDNPGRSPPGIQVLKNGGKESQLSLKIAFLMDDVESVRDLEKHFQNLRNRLLYVEDPKFFPFPRNVKLYKGDTLVIEGEHLTYASDESDVNVTVGTMPCNVTSLALTQLVCTPPDQQPADTDELGVKTEHGLPLVVVRVGRTLRFPIGYLHYDVAKSYPIPPEAIAGIAAGTFSLVFLFVLVLVVYRRKSTQAEREYKRIQIQMDTLESNVRMECKQAFAELQTDMTDLTADLESSGIPTLDHKNYIMKVFFPGVIDHPILNDPRARNNVSRTNYDAAMVQFEQLINNKCFLLTFVETLEAQKDFNIRDKVNVASLLMIVLMSKMEYATDVLMSLLLRLIDKAVNTKHPQLMLRRTESVVEKMLTNWMALCMYNYLKDYAGSSLFLLFKAIKHQIEKGPVDVVTHDARYSLSEERLLREQIEHSVVTLHVVQDDLDEKIQCKVLDCDTISQVKSKILDALYKNTPFSLRPSIHEVDLEWRHGRGGHLSLQDEDLTTKCSGGWRKINTLAHYGVKESAVMSLIPRQNDGFAVNCKPPCHACKTSSHHRHGSNHCSATHLHQNQQPHYHHYHHHHVHHHHHLANAAGNAQIGPAIVYSHTPVGGGGIYYESQHSPPPPPVITANGDVEAGHGGHNRRLYHLVRPLEESHYASTGGGGLGLIGGKHHHRHHHPERTHKAIPEIFLTRLLSTKGTVQKFVDDFLNTILTANEALPSAIKWLFDLLDEAARRHGIVDPEVAHAWKSNSLPLRFWVNFIKNPDFMFDINKSTTVDSSLSVIAQTFMDSCSTTEHRLGKDSPSNKLLFAKDIPHYREKVGRFYTDVQRLPQISDQEMAAAMQLLSAAHVNEFDVIAALKELYIYVSKYYEQILDALETDAGCRKLHLAHRLENVACTMEGEETNAC
ncbi:plexin-B isoform X2 [Orussus abietinus]|uniref:plexin-B isoform X2 n=1 Tax=Orussus abietinus TaxID=222816 RepID=UPI000626AE72|nr:plexin-B isoform X2 [Orussus abietinus]